MAVFWSKADPQIIELTKQVIDRYHKHLNSARIGVVMRSEAPSTNGNVTLAKCKKVSAELQLHIPYQFIIWIAEDEWQRLSTRQHEALLDHELSHIGWDGINAHIKGHDVEEFNHILKRWGPWWPDSDGFSIAIQQPLPLPPSPDEPRREGSVGTIDFGKIAREVTEGLRAQGIDAESIAAGMEGE